VSLWFLPLAFSAFRRLFAEAHIAEGLTYLPDGGAVFDGGKVAQIGLLAERLQDAAKDFAGARLRQRFDKSQNRRHGHGTNRVAHVLLYLVGKRTRDFDSLFHDDERGDSLSLNLVGNADGADLRALPRAAVSFPHRLWHLRERGLLQEVPLLS